MKRGKVSIINEVNQLPPFEVRLTRREEICRWMRHPPAPLLGASDHHLASLLFSAHQYSAIFQSGLES